MTAEATSTSDGRGDSPGDEYGGVLGAFPYAFRASSSRLFRSYVIIGGLLIGLVTIVFGMALVQLLADTVGGGSGTFSFVRSFYILVGLTVVIPLLAPVLLVARRHRREGSTPAYDRALSGGGYLFVFSLYLTLVVTAPPELREDPSGVFAPVVTFLYDLPPIAGAIPPLVALGVGYALHRRYRGRD